LSLLLRKAGLEGWGMAQMIQCLPSKCEALSSKPSTARERERERERERGWCETHYIAQAGLKLIILLPQGPECYDYRSVPSMSG
jgi:hypothetical protein